MHGYRYVMNPRVAFVVGVQEKQLHECNHDRVLVLQPRDVLCESFSWRRRLTTLRQEQTK